jgi:hypothetical protein
MLRQKQMVFLTGNYSDKEIIHVGFEASTQQH